ncbi:hypothetical protein CAPTEDRAFT_189659, partial [Capitella teleta]
MQPGELNMILPDSFNVYRKDRSTTQPSKRGGGILLAIDTNIKSNRPDDLENDFEIIVCEIICKRRSKIAVILCYKPPDSDSASFNASLTAILDNVYREFQDVCMHGDFNLPAIDWRHPDRCSRATDSEFVCITQSHSLEQINFNPSNAYGNVLDIIFTSDLNLLYDVVALEDVFPSDHKVLYFNVALSLPIVSKHTRNVFNFKWANLTMLQSKLNRLSECFNEDLDDISVWTSWNDDVLEISKQCIPK